MEDIERDNEKRRNIFYSKHWKIVIFFYFLYLITQNLKLIFLMCLIMYSVQLGYKKARTRINRLLNNKHYSEVFIVTVFTVEKTIRRTLHQLIISSGFSTEITKKILKDIRGLEAIKKNWSYYDPENKTIVDIIGNDNCTKITNYFKMRNKIIHGIHVYNLETCRESTIDLLSVLDDIKIRFKNNYDFDGWEKLSPRPKSYLHVDSKVRKINNNTR